MNYNQRGVETTSKKATYCGVQEGRNQASIIALSWYATSWYSSEVFNRVKVVGSGTNDGLIVVNQCY